MADPIRLTDTQLNTIVSSINRLAEHSGGWDWHSAIPTAVGSLLGFLFALFLDWLKTRRELRKADRERREGEVSKLGAAIVMLLFDLETSIHTIEQQVIPHYESSRNGLDVFEAAVANPTRLATVQADIQPFIGETFRRSPAPNLTAINAFDSLPFLLRKYAQILKECGWVVTFAKDLKFILSERNRLIDTVTSKENSYSLDDL